MTRRESLAVMGGASLAPFIVDPINALLGGLVDGIIRKAQAATTPYALPPRNFVHINLGGGAPRWLWDLPLRGYDVNAPIQPNAMVSTRFRDVGPQYSGQAMDYVTVPVTRGGVTLHMPYMWSLGVPRPGGGQAPMADLIANMMVIRGVDLGVDGHGVNSYKQLRPVNSAPSITGMVADASPAPVPAVGLSGGAYGSYRSKRGIGQTEASGSGALSTILDPFDRQGDGITGTPFLSRRQALDEAMRRASGALRNFARSSNPGAENLFDMRDAAENTIRVGVGNLSAIYNGLFAKYDDLIRRCAIATIPGINDKAIPWSSMIMTPGVGTLQTSFHEGYCRNPDLRTIITPNTQLPGLAAGFAVAEYLLTQRYSSSVLFGNGIVSGIDFQDTWSRGTPGTPDMPDPFLASGGIGHDQHFCGSVNSLLSTTFLYHSLSACLYEFIGVLKAAGVFDETVIQVGGEFGRDPAGNQKGSDHGWQAMSTSLFSGAIRKPLIVGNTKPYPVNSSTPGSWGAAGLTLVDGVSQALTLGHMTSTVAHLLRVQPLLSNNSTLVVEDASGLNPTVDLAKEVAS